MSARVYPWIKVRQVLFKLQFKEITLPDNDNIFFHSPDMGLVTLRNRKEGISEIQIKIICSNIGFSFTEFIRLIDTL